MARPETLSAPLSGADAGPRPELSVVVTLFQERSTLEELHARLAAALEALGRPFELIYVDDGSTDGTFAELERLHAGDDARPGGAAQAQLRPAPGDARGPRRAPAATSS